MRIAYIGNFTQEHCTEVHLAATLEDLGHEVIRLQEDDPNTREQLDNLIWTFPERGIKLLLFTRTWGETLTLEHLAKFKEAGIPTASYHLDLYVGLAREGLHKGVPLEHILQTDPFWRTDYVFTPDGDAGTQEVMRANGVNHIYMKPGVFKKECYKLPPLVDPLKEVLFVGGGAPTGQPNQYGHPEWPYRGQLLQWLEMNYPRGERYFKYGYPDRTIRNKELNQLYADFKVSIGDSICLNFDHTHYWSDRVYETLGRGGFIIHPYIKGLDEEFTDKENIVFYEYNNWKQLRELIDYYLTHEDERVKIRDAGHEFVKNNATYNNRLEQMLDIVFSIKNPDNPYKGQGIVEAKNET